MCDYGQDKEKELKEIKGFRFKPVELVDKPILEDWFRRFPPVVCELSFPNIFIWRRSEHSAYAIINDNLCLLVQPDFEPAYFLPPLGKSNLVQTVATCLEIVPRLSRVPEEMVKLLGESFWIEEDPDNADYIYKTEDLAELKGKRFDGKRNRIKKFERSVNSQYVRLTQEHFHGCRELLEKWYRERESENGTGFFVAARQAVEEAFRFYETLNFVGAAIIINGKVEAFTVASELSSDTAVIHFEFTSSAYPGLNQFINREFVRRELGAYAFINREQDLGLPGLRKYKLSYHPIDLVKKFNVFQRK